MDKDFPQAPAGEFVMFSSDDGQVRIECRFEGDTLWLSQAIICELYGKAKATISERIKHIFSEGELAEDSVVRFYRTTASDRKGYNIQSRRFLLLPAAGFRGCWAPSARPKRKGRIVNGLLPDREHGYTARNTATTLSAFLEGNAQPWWLFYARLFYARMSARWAC